MNTEGFKPLETDLKNSICNGKQIAVMNIDNKASEDKEFRSMVFKMSEGALTRLVFDLSDKLESSEARVKELEQELEVQESLKRSALLLSDSSNDLLEKQNQRIKELEGKVKDQFWKDGDGGMYFVEKKNRWEQWCKELGIKP